MARVAAPKVMKKIRDLTGLKLMANQIREDLMKMLCEAKSGHSGGPLGLADIYTALYFHVMTHKPGDPFWEDRDRLILSNGHVVPIRYASMASAGYMPREELSTLRKLHTRLQGHPHRLDLPGLETSAGSLGQGFGIAVGIAYGARMRGKSFKVYCSLGDGELQEGSVWEAVMSAAHWKLDNLIAFVDRNRLQIDGATEDIMALEPLDKKFKAFNWKVITVNGHDMAAVLAAFRAAQRTKGRPTMILFNTVMGKGVSFMEDKYEWHGKPPNKDELAIALQDLTKEREALLNGHATLVRG